MVRVCQATGTMNPHLTVSTGPSTGLVHVKMLDLTAVMAAISIIIVPTSKMVQEVVLSHLPLETMEQS